MGPENINFTDMLFYFNSAIAQSMAALFAIIGMFYIFRLQIQENKLSRTYDSAKEWFWVYQGKYSPGKDAKTFLDKDVKTHIEHADQLFSKTWSDGKIALKDYRTQINNQLKTKAELTEKIKLPLYLILSIFIISVLALSFTNIISKSFATIIIYLGLIISTIIVTLIKIVRYIYLSMKDSKDELINPPA